MAWNSFLKNLLGNSDADTVDTADPSSPRNVSLSGRAFKQQFQESANAVLLDVRTAAEFASGTIPGSVNIDFMSAAFAKNISRMSKDATYFVFCRSGNRSGQACRVMHQMGFDVRNLSGGIGAYPF